MALGNVSFVIADRQVKRYTNVCLQLSRSKSMGGPEFAKANEVGGVKWI